MFEREDVVMSQAGKRTRRRRMVECKIETRRWYRVSDWAVHITASWFKRLGLERLFREKKKARHSQGKHEEEEREEKAPVG